MEGKFYWERRLSGMTRIGTSSREASDSEPKVNTRLLNQELKGSKVVRASVSGIRGMLVSVLYCDRHPVFTKYPSSAHLFPPEATDVFLALKPPLHSDQHHLSL